MRNLIFLWEDPRVLGEVSLTAGDFPLVLKMKQAVVGQEAKHRSKNVVQLENAAAVA
jgi:hypothetical protein